MVAAVRLAPPAQQPDPDLVDLGPARSCHARAVRPPPPPERVHRDTLAERWRAVTPRGGAVPGPGVAGTGRQQEQPGDDERDRPDDPAERGEVVDEELGDADPAEEQPAAQDEVGVGRAVETAQEQPGRGEHPGDRGDRVSHREARRGVPGGGAEQGPRGHERGGGGAEAGDPGGHPGERARRLGQAALRGDGPHAHGHDASGDDAVDEGRDEVVVEGRRRRDDGEGVLQPRGEADRRGPGGERQRGPRLRDPGEGQLPEAEQEQPRRDVARGGPGDDGEDGGEGAGGTARGDEVRGDRAQRAARERGGGEEEDRRGGGQAQRAGRLGDGRRAGEEAGDDEAQGDRGRDVGGVAADRDGGGQQRGEDDDGGDDEVAHGIGRVDPGDDPAGEQREGDREGPHEGERRARRRATGPPGGEAEDGEEGRDDPAEVTRHDGGEHRGAGDGQDGEQLAVPAARQLEPGEGQHAGDDEAHARRDPLVAAGDGHDVEVGRGDTRGHQGDRGAADPGPLARGPEVGLATAHPERDEHGGEDGAGRDPGTRPEPALLDGEDEEHGDARHRDDGPGDGEGGGDAALAAVPGHDRCGRGSGGGHPAARRRQRRTGCRRCGRRGRPLRGGPGGRCRCGCRHRGRRWGRGRGTAGTGAAVRAASTSSSARRRASPLPTE